MNDSLIQIMKFRGIESLDRIVIGDHDAWEQTSIWIQQKFKMIVVRALPEMKAAGISKKEALIQVCLAGYESFSKDFYEYKMLKNPEIMFHDLTYYLKGIHSFVEKQIAETGDEKDLADLVMLNAADRILGNGWFDPHEPSSI
jgi:hypothetical protein